MNFSINKTHDCCLCSRKLPAVEGIKIAQNFLLFQSSDPNHSEVESEVKSRDNLRLPF